MSQITAKLKPTAGFSHFVHIALTCLLPALMFVFVRTGFFGLAAAVVILSKWRMFAVKPRHWPANIRANAVDIFVGLAALIFMTHSDSQMFQLLWAVAYGTWLLAVKPLSTTFGVMIQALIAQTLGLIALFIAWGDAHSIVLVAGTWIVCYNTARHFFVSFEETMVRYLSGVWAYFAAALVWILSHWLLFYGPIAQPALLLSVLSFGMGGIYYLEKSDKMSVLQRRQLIFFMIAITLIVLTFSDWGDKAI